MNPTRMMRGATISVGARYAVPTADVRPTTVSRVADVEESRPAARSAELPNAERPRMRMSTIVTFGYRSSPRLLRGTVWRRARQR